MSCMCVRQYLSGTFCPAGHCGPVRLWAHSALQQAILRHILSAARMVFMVFACLSASETGTLQNECCRLMHPLRAQERYEEGYGTVLDSGTTFTYLPTDAFQSFKEAVTAFALEHGLKSVKGPDPKVSACRPQHCLQGSTQARQDQRPALWGTFVEVPSAGN